MTKSCPLYNFETIQDNFFKLHTRNNVKDIKMICSVQEL